jgi:hypothetical protein
VLTILLGFALRVHQLEGQSMWSDEGLSVYRSALSAQEILTNTITVDGVETQDTTPPLYFLIVHLFRATAGDSVFAMRFAGVILSSLSIPLIYALGSVSLGRRVGLIAAIFMAISPFHVWQSQVLRNYGLLLTLNLLSVYGLFRYLLAVSGRRRSGWLLLWLVASLLGIYTHFFALFIFAYGLLALVVWAVIRRGIGRLLRKIWFWIAVGVAILIVLPIVAYGLDRFMAGQQRDFVFVPLSRVLIQAMSAFSVGVQQTLTFEWWRFLPVVLIALAGLWFAWRRRPLAATLLLGYQIIPLGILYGLSYINPIYNGVRHLLIGLPPFLILLASGIAGPLQSAGDEEGQAGLRRIWRVAGPVLAVVVLAIQLNWLNQQFTSPDLIRDDVRGPALYLNENAGPADVIVLHDAIIEPTFDYYYEGVAPVILIPEFIVSDVKSAIQSLQAAGNDADRVWFLTRPTPRTGFDREVLPTWARENWPRFANRQYEWLWLDVALEGFLPNAILDSVPDEAAITGLSWEQTLRVHGYDIPETVTAGDGWWMTFYLSQPGPIPVEHILSLRLVDDAGEVWAQMDEIIDRGFPPATAEADTLMRYDHQVTVPPGVPPGRYALLARLVRAADGHTVPLSGGEVEHRLIDVTVTGASCSANAGDIPADVVLDKAFGPALSLVAYDRPPGEAWAGHPLSLTLWWCAGQQPETDYRLRLQLIDGAGRVVSESTGPLLREDHPTSQWPEDSLLMGKPSSIIPGDIEAGQYDLRLSLLAPGSDQGQRIGWPLGSRSLSLGLFEVIPWPKETELPPIAFPLRADLGQPAIFEFHGYDLQTNGQSLEKLSAGDELRLNLIWRSATGDVPISYKVFVHLLDEDGQIATQSDTLPAGGLRPTTGWREGEVISDEHVLIIPEGSEPGTYTLWIGQYDPETTQRLPVFVGGQEQADGRLKIGSLSVQP